MPPKPLTSGLPDVPGLVGDGWFDPSDVEDFFSLLGGGFNPFEKY